MNSMKMFVFGAVAAVSFALPAEAQIWKRGDVATQSGDRVIRRTDSRVINGVSCVDVQLDRSGSRRTEQVCDFDRDGVYGDTDDRRIEAQRREAARRNGSVYDRRNRDDDRDHDVYRNRGQSRAAEVHARNEARKRAHDLEKREREIERERLKVLERRQKELEKQRRDLEKERRKSGKGRDGRWL